jgi:very-short-patch-repair endonuclease
MGVRVVTWNRYGHRRSYVTDDDGTSLGYRDEKTGEVVVLVEACAAELRAALEPVPEPRAAEPPRAEPSREQPPRAEQRTPDSRTRDPRRQAAARKGLAAQSWHKPTLSEKALSDELVRSSPFVWRREEVWEQYRLDFFCEAARLAVEVDGSSHRHKAAYDAERDAYFHALGIDTIRVSAADVERDCANVVARLNRECIARTGSVPPTEVPARGLVARLLGRTQAVERPALAPQEYQGRRRGGAFVCARCRVEHAAARRSARATNCCVSCAG